MNRDKTFKTLRSIADILEIPEEAFFDRANCSVDVALMNYSQERDLIALFSELKNHDARQACLDFVRRQVAEELEAPGDVSGTLPLIP